MFGRAQPALLYLSPACVAAFGVTAAWRGELGAAWTWSDGDGEEGQGQEGEKGEEGKEEEGEAQARDADAQIRADE